MRYYLFLLMLGLSANVLQEGAGATDSLSSSTSKSSSGSYQGIKEIIEKMQTQDKLSPKEEQDFNAALKEVQNKINVSPKGKTDLSPFEQKIYSQNLLNTIQPTIQHILESGKKILWGIDLNFVEERGKKIRDSVSEGGADVTSVISMYQRGKDDINTRLQEKDDAIKEIKKKTQETKEKLNSLNAVSIFKRASVKKKIIQDEQVTLKALQKKIIALNEKLGSLRSSNERAIKTIMVVTKLDRAVIEQLPSRLEWRKKRPLQKLVMEDKKEVAYRDGDELP